MNPRVFEHFNKFEGTYEKLKEEYDSIKSDMHTISTMEISDDAKKLPLEELQKQINDVKERMHDCIDEL